MIEMWHPVHARVLPCAAEENELERLLREGWVRSKEELDQPKVAARVRDAFDEAVDEMIRREEREERKLHRVMSNGRGSMPLKSR